jgi:hypothetical protein
MSCATSIGSWSALVARLDAENTAARWAANVPALRDVASVGDLAIWTQRGHSQADQVLCALVQLAALDGGDDPDAVLVVLHLRWPGFRYLIQLVGTVEQSAEELVAGQAVIQIRSYPWRRRPRRCAANLLLDTQAAVGRELRVSGRCCDPRDAEVAIDAMDREVRPVRLVDEDALDVYDLFTWATRTRVVTVDEVRLLLEIELAAEYLRGPRAVIADLHGWTTRTLDRRRHRTLAALRDAAPAYLTAVA